MDVVAYDGSPRGRRGDTVDDGGVCWLARKCSASIRIRAGFADFVRRRVCAAGVRHLVLLVSTRPLESSPHQVPRHSVSQQSAKQPPHRRASAVSIIFVGLLSRSSVALLGFCYQTLPGWKRQNWGSVYSPPLVPGFILQLVAWESIVVQYNACPWC